MEQLIRLIPEQWALWKNAIEIQRSKDSSHDSRVFSQWISKELNELEQFYKLPHKDLEKERAVYFESIKKSFVKNCQPQLKTKSYENFTRTEFNNAVLLGYRTYFKDLDLFEKAWIHFDRDWKKFIDFMKSIKKSTDPEKELRGLIGVTKV